MAIAAEVGFLFAARVMGGKRSEALENHFDRYEH
jgi:hypothetical protein